ncbi:trigger factor [Fibrella aestuarina BUZ 2]|uniref:Trigger factor n=1 Tax=Fibrella aestuarina BUZ 2 TaxID=1166018 RepID=I0KDG6_9BACT|nr:trigger factor [Fibrella aestuarina]CCH02169.1 trigger factor [Fibrella aestuarina BUZ 2]
MDIVLDKTSETNASLIITLKPEDYRPEVDKKLKQYGKQVSLKGFRPGHVPAAVVRKMYGKGILVDEINNLLNKSLSSYIRENKLQVVGDPMPNREEADAIDWDNQDDYKFSYELGLASDFDVDLATLGSVNHYTIEAGDKEVDETIENLRKQFHAHTHADAIAEGDTVYGELKQLTAPEGAEPFETKTALPLNKIAADVLGTFIGKAKGETVTFDMATAFPDEKDRALATGVKKEETGNLTGDFTFTIEDITRHEPAELNQEFFDKVLGVGAVSDETEFRTKVREIMGQNYARESDNLLRRDIEDALLENILISLPDEFLKNWLLTVNEGKFTPEQIEEQYPDFTKSAKLQLIKNKVAEQANIDVNFEEVMDSTRQMVRDQFGFAGDMGDEMKETVDKIARNYLMDEKNNGQNYTTTFNRVFDDKVIDYIKSQLTVVDQTITLDEFRDRANAQ